MKRVILIFFAVLSVFFAGCVKEKPRLSTEEEYRLRQEKRMRRARQAREDRITSLSGLNSVELEELDRTSRANDLNPNPGSFVFSPKSENPHSSDKVMKELNDSDQKRMKDYNDSVKQKQKSGRSRVYGI